MSTAGKPATIRKPDLREIEQFLYREANLLDQKRWDEWLELFADDGCYWVPLFPEQDDPMAHTSLFYEDRPLMRMRIDRLRHPRAFSQEPPTMTSHVVSNVILESVDETTGEYAVRESFHMLEFRRDEQRIFGGFATFRLAPVDHGLSIKLKRVDLINSAGVLEPLQLFI
ncbi:MAG: aromatic-ring-hydroxylating dioxygenase subunit beta [Candidatus Binataceae bacterium]